MRELISPMVQLAISDGLVFKLERDRVWRALDLGLRSVRAGNVRLR